MTRNKFLKLCKKSGVIVNHCDSKYIFIEAPKGFVFGGTDLHYKSDSNLHGGFTAGEWYDYFAWLGEETVQPCKIKDCEYCNC